MFYCKAPYEHPPKDPTRNAPRLVKTAQNTLAWSACSQVALVKAMQRAVEEKIHGMTGFWAWDFWAPRLGLGFSAPKVLV